MAEEHSHPSLAWGAETHAIPLLVDNTLSDYRSTAAAGGMLEKTMPEHPELESLTPPRSHQTDGS